MVDSHLQTLPCKNSVIPESRAPAVWQAWAPAGREEGAQGGGVGTARAEEGVCPIRGVEVKREVIWGKGRQVRPACLPDKGNQGKRWDPRPRGVRRSLRTSGPV